MWVGADPGTCRRCHSRPTTVHDDPPPRGGAVILVCTTLYNYSLSDYHSQLYQGAWKWLHWHDGQARWRAPLSSRRSTRTVHLAMGGKGNSQFLIPQYISIVNLHTEQKGVWKGPQRPRARRSRGRAHLRDHRPLRPERGRPTSQAAARAGRVGRPACTVVRGPRR
jgi:hypothetical protein